MQRFSFLVLAPLALVACRQDQSTDSAALTGLAPGLSATAAGGAAGAVYVVSNDPAANAVLVFPRAGDGALGEPVSVPTGGIGTGGGLGNQGAVALSADGRHLYAINPGSNEISAFRVHGLGLKFLGNVSSAGEMPISLALHGNLLYVLNDGGTANVTGFRVSGGGQLQMIAGSTRQLSIAAPDAAQVGISPDGRRLVVTEKATNMLVGWDIASDGTLNNRSLTPSASPTPFGFAFDRRGTLLVSEAVGGAADASVLSSYRVGAAGWLAVSPSTATTETAACWVVVTPHGRFAYTTNTGSASVSGFKVGMAGTIALLNADGVTGTTAAGPIDAAISRNGRYLYTLNAGADAISAFRIGVDGSLEHLGDTPGLPDGASGLAAD
jgi:6-phosphogluconolactonase (cycloisomerase 2 family)